MLPEVSEELKHHYNDMKSVGLSHVSLATLIASDGQTVAAAVVIGYFCIKMYDSNHNR